VATSNQTGDAFTSVVKVCFRGGEHGVVEVTDGVSALAVADVCRRAGVMFDAVVLHHDLPVWRGQIDSSDESTGAVADDELVYRGGQASTHEHVGEQPFRDALWSPAGLRSGVARRATQARGEVRRRCSHRASRGSSCAPDRTGFVRRMCTGSRRCRCAQKAGRPATSPIDVMRLLRGPRPNRPRAGHLAMSAVHRPCGTPPRTARSIGPSSGELAEPCPRSPGRGVGRRRRLHAASRRTERACRPERHPWSDDERCAHVSPSLTRCVTRCPSEGAR
jgi:hypothetical protein